MTSSPDAGHGGPAPGEGVQDLAGILNRRCRQAVSLALLPATDAQEAWLAAILEEAADLERDGGVQVAGFLRALAGLVEGEALPAALAGTADPFRSALRAVAADIAAARADMTPQPEAQGPLDPGEREAVAELAARVASILRRRDRPAARALADALDAARRAPGLDAPASAYLGVLRDVLSGRQVKAQVLRLDEPYRSAYLSLERVLAGADPLDGLLDRLDHNLRLVGTHGGDEARRALGRVLEEVGSAAEAGGEAELARFIGLLRDGLDGRPVPEVRWSDPRLQARWERLGPMVAGRG